jgi:hypothetical protein
MFGAITAARDTLADVAIVVYVILAQESAFSEGMVRRRASGNGPRPVGSA